MARALGRNIAARWLTGDPERPPPAGSEVADEVVAMLRPLA